MGWIFEFWMKDLASIMAIGMENVECQINVNGVDNNVSHGQPLHESIRAKNVEIRQLNDELKAKDIEIKRLKRLMIQMNESNQVKTMVMKQKLS